MKPPETEAEKKKSIFSPGGKVIVKSLTTVKFRYNCETSILQFRGGNWKVTSPIA